jgi:NADH-quinone oxidoreductase subunit L
MLAQETAHAVESAGWFLEHAWLIPVIPAVAFFGIILFGKRLPKGGSELGIASMVAAFVIAAGTTVQWVDRVKSSHGEEVAPVVKQWTWWQSGGVEFGIGQQIDGLAVMALILVTFISSLVQLYSTEYVRGDRRFTHFFASLTLFSAGMLAMVLAPNMVQLILGWEIMGLCSFMLIGHWWEEEANSRAALKAFFTVRVGDMGLLVGTAMLLGIFGTLDIVGINERAANGEFESKNLLMWAAVALFIACIGKSGQFPLHTWLPDAMAGPTPVSSLLHSSTMVVAGVFLVARVYPVFHVGLDINLAGQNFNLIAVIGGITVLIAALLAFVQNDIKKVLAYSTVSQLGYMMMGLGVGAWNAAVFHIFTHAFFKCCLFLCAGSVSHTASHHSFDMKKDMGGIWRKMPVTFGTWIVSTAALCGVPFFSGFFSKDEIIDSAKHADYTVFFYVGLIGAFMTTAYMTRATYLTFFGAPRGGAAHFMGVDDHAHELEPAHAGHGADEPEVQQEHELDAAGPRALHADDGHDPHGHDPHGHDDHAVSHSRKLPFAPFDSPWQLTAPLIVLAVLAIGSGYLNAPAFDILWFEHQTESSIGLPFAEHGEEHAEEGAAAEDESHAAEGEDAAHDTHGDDAAIYSVPHPPEFKWVNALPSIVLVALGFLISLGMSMALFGDARARARSPLRPLAGLTQRNAVLRAGHTFLVQKYYLDHLYEKVIVRGIAHPIARAAYWINQNVIDAIVNGAGRSGKRTGDWIYKNIDQRVVDGAVNASGLVTSEGGHALQPVQSGKVNQYGALLFGAAAVGAIVLILINS